MTNPFRGITASVVFLLGLAITLPASATHMYSSGALEFETEDQSMWADGPAFVAGDTFFLGPEWGPSRTTLGGIIGSRTTTTVNTNPLWWAWRGCIAVSPDFICGSEPDPGAEDIVTDTRTGAKVDIVSSGKFGLEFGYNIDSGSVDATVDYSADAELPTKTPITGDLIDLKATSSLNDGSIMTSSPNAEAFVNAIGELNFAFDNAQACLIFAGCTAESGKLDLVDFAEKLELLLLDPGSLKVLPNALPGPTASDPRVPLAEIGILNQELTLEFAIDTAPPPPPVGFKLTSSTFGTLADTTTPLPDVSFDLATLGFQFPVIDTDGGLDPAGDKITSDGRSDALTLKVDLDTLGIMSGALPPLGANFNLIDTGGFKVALNIDVLDIEAGPVLGITQDFELEPTLMVHIEFNKDVEINGQIVREWTGAWDDLPAFAARTAGDLILTPTFWVDAMFTNALGLDLGLIGTLDLFKVSLVASAGGVNLIGTNPISLNSLLGIGNQLFSTPKLEIPITSIPFTLGGFDPIVGQRIIITIPEPATIVLLLTALGGIAAQRRRLHRKLAH